MRFVVIRRSPHAASNPICSVYSGHLGYPDNKWLSRCLVRIFGAAIAAFVPASVEERLVNLLIFGLAPAFAFYVSGYIVRYLLGFACKLCELLTASVLRRLAWVATGCAKLTVCRKMDAEAVLSEQERIPFIASSGSASLQVRV
jgi:hypothetical protein